MAGPSHISRELAGGVWRAHPKLETPSDIHRIETGASLCLCCMTGGRPSLQQTRPRLHKLFSHCGHRRPRRAARRLQVAVEGADACCVSVVVPYSIPICGRRTARTRAIRFRRCRWIVCELHAALRTHVVRITFASAALLSSMSRLVKKGLMRLDDAMHMLHHSTRLEAQSFLEEARCVLSAITVLP